MLPNILHHTKHRVLNFLLRIKAFRHIWWTPVQSFFNCSYSISQESPFTYLLPLSRKSLGPGHFTAFVNHCNYVWWITLTLELKFGSYFHHYFNIHLQGNLVKERLILAHKFKLRKHGSPYTYEGFLIQDSRVWGGLLIFQYGRSDMKQQSINLKSIF